MFSVCHGQNVCTSSPLYRRTPYTVFPTAFSAINEYLRNEPIRAFRTNKFVANDPSPASWNDTIPSRPVRLNKMKTKMSQKLAKICERKTCSAFAKYSARKWAAWRRGCSQITLEFLVLFCYTRADGSRRDVKWTFGTETAHWRYFNNAKFHYSMFKRSEVIVLTDKQTNKQTEILHNTATSFRYMLRRWKMMTAP